MAWFTAKTAHQGYSRVSLGTPSPRDSAVISEEQKYLVMSDEQSLPDSGRSLWTKLNRSLKRLRSPTARDTNGCSRYHLFLFLASTTTFATISFIGILAFTVANVPLPHCGSSVREAHDLGCVFDVMSNSWMPRECYFEDLALDFLSLPDTAWYADEEHNETVPLGEFEKGEMPLVYPSFGHHDRHCLYTWRKLQHAIDNKLMVDAESVSQMHVKHCTDYLVGRFPDVKPTLSHRSFSRCVEL